VLGPAIRVIDAETLQAHDPQLANLRDERTDWEFYATQKPVLALFILSGEPRPESLLFVDADTWFFSDPAPLFAELGEASIGLSPHRFPPDAQDLLKYGAFNAGCVYWRNDPQGLRCLEDWRSDCIACCDQEVRPDGRFMNQGYLTGWPERYRGVHIIRHPGVNLAPWNIDSHVLRGGTPLRADDLDVIFYHYSGLVPEGDGRWASFYPHVHRQFDLIRDAIYGPYLRAVERERKAIQEATGVDGTGTVRQLTIGPCMKRFYASR
jgi:hypothetical protein